EPQHGGGIQLADQARARAVELLLPAGPPSPLDVGEVGRRIEAPGRRGRREEAFEGRGADVELKDAPAGELPLHRHEQLPDAAPQEVAGLAAIVLAEPGRADGLPVRPDAAAAAVLDVVRAAKRARAAEPVGSRLLPLGIVGWRAPEA